MLEMSEVYVLDENIVLRSINNKFWALDTRLGAQYKINRVSYDILSLLDGSKTVKEVIDNASVKYDVSDSIFRDDALGLLENALSKKIITRS